MTANEDATSIGLTVELPARSNPQANLEWVFGFMPSLGYSAEVAARGYASDEWHMDYLNIVELANRLGMSDDDFGILVKRIQDRNRSIWGAYSDFHESSH